MSARNPLTPFIDEYGFMVLDGGLATELEARGYDLNDELWSARVLLEDPAAIRQLHFDYLAAGADCIITASYQGTVTGFMKRGLGRSEAEELLRSSVELAVGARDAFWRDRSNRALRHKPIVAASIGPYGAYLADGSEYTGLYDLDEAGLIEFHRERWLVMAQTDADILACETIPSFAECRALLQLLLDTPGRYAWFAFSCRDSMHISDGSRLTECLTYLDQFEQVAAVGINCTAPRFVPGLLAEAGSVTGKPLLVYPNSGEEYDAGSKRWFGQSDAGEFATSCQAWHKIGASVLGGCCRTGPEHIRQIRQRFSGGGT
jgi:homocysteine S-methyltransferase